MLRGLSALLGLRMGRRSVIVVYRKFVNSETRAREKKIEVIDNAYIREKCQYTLLTEKMMPFDPFPW